MTNIHDAAEDFAAQALAGFCDLNGERVRPVRNGALRATATPEGKVALVVGGGSGHYPTFAGYVGPGFADAAVAGDVFASPSTAAIARVGRLANRGGGVVFGFGNYAGDVLNFGLAAERLCAEGIDARIMRVTDDVASAGPDTPALRRGIAGNLVVLKITGAAAEAGLSIDEVMRVGELANRNTFSLGVAFKGCTLPGAKTPLFSVAKGKMEVGLGIHGEPGIREVDQLPASELATLLVDPLLAERPKGAGSRVAVLLNGLGATKYEELFVLWTSVSARLRAAGLELVAPEAGELVTSLDMAGCSLTLTWLDDEIEGYWLAPCDAVAFRRGRSMDAVLSTEAIVDEDPVVAVDESTRASRQTGACITELLGRLLAALRLAEDELGRIDAQAGDGDHGQGMARGCAAALDAATKAASRNAGAKSVLAAAADAWADRAGGTSGVIWGLALRGWSDALSDTAKLEEAAVVAGAGNALEAVMRLGGARPGDKTLVDAFIPFVDTLKAEQQAGKSLAVAWDAATKAARQAAEETSKLKPRLGRARPLAERSLGHPDAGAVSFALMAGVVGDLLRERG